MMNSFRVYPDYRTAVKQLQTVTPVIYFLSSQAPIAMGGGITFSSPGPSVITAGNPISFSVSNYNIIDPTLSIALLSGGTIISIPIPGVYIIDYETVLTTNDSIALYSSSTATGSFSQISNSLIGGIAGSYLHGNILVNISVPIYIKLCPVGDTIVGNCNLTIIKF